MFLAQRPFWFQSWPRQAVLALALCASAGGCQTVQFYGQAVAGQLDLLHDRVPVDRLLADPTVDPALARRLELTRTILDFAVERIALPVGGRYRSFVEVNREYVVWNVFATEEFSVAPIVWCYPIAGCAVYRGYFSRSAAEREAERLWLAGRDVRVDGVAAYSTLGWFDDPLLSTFLEWPPESVAGLLFHELAHGRVYAKGDTAFSESYASFVEGEALEQWLSERGDAAALMSWQERRAAAERFARFMRGWRKILDDVYGAAPPDFAGRLLKSETLRLVKECYRLHRDALGAGRRDGEFDGILDNADFIPWMAYSEWVPAFAALFRSVGSDWERFHAAAEALAKLDAPRRQEELEALGERALAADLVDRADDPIQCHALTVYPASKQ